ncbi:MAG: thiamine-phosphate kinase [Dehalococcoidia bacterium]
MAEPNEALGEFALIDRIVERLGDAAARDILVPPGDDAAAWTTEAGVSVATVDVLVEGNHFRADTMSRGDLGWRAMAANVSDIAAMGATPEFAFIGLVLPPHEPLESIDRLVDGMAEACRAMGVRVGGGDIVRGDRLTISVTITGRTASSDALLRRDSARVGDRVAVSGHLGAAAAGLALIEAGRGGGDGAGAPLLLAHRRPMPRVALGRAAAEAGVRCGMDVSDGLLQDLGHIAERSNVGIEVQTSKIPLHPAAVAELGAQAALDLALGGGEDFELAMTAPSAILEAVGHTEPRLTSIGVVVEDHPGEAWALHDDGTRYVPAVSGWDQMRAGAS